MYNFIIKKLLKLVLSIYFYIYLNIGRGGGGVGEASKLASVRACIDFHSKSLGDAVTYILYSCKKYNDKYS